MNRAGPFATIEAMKNWLIPTGLIGLGLVPVIAGGLRLNELAGGAAVIPDGDRVSTALVPLVPHIVSVTVFSMLGAFQFAPGSRRRKPRRHRIAGRVVVPAGLVAASSGLWLSLSSAAIQGGALAVIRIVVAMAMSASLVLGLVAVLRRDFRRHRAWMIRGYAIGMGAGTQAFTQAAWLLAVGPMTPGGRIGTMAAGWLINVLVAEWIIRRAPGRTRPAPRTYAGRPVLNLNLNR
jgi:hypothetical protein